MYRIAKEDLYRSILMKPLEKGADQLCVLSGYVKPYIIEDYMNDAIRHNRDFQLRIVHGMARSQGITNEDHDRFLNLSNGNNLEFFYFIGDTNRVQSVHAKIYIWLRNNKPIKAFLGSANFTDQGFRNEQNRIEMMTKAEPKEAHRIFANYLSLSKSITNQNIKQHIKIVTKESDPSNIEEIQTTRIYLTDNKGRIYTKSGLNLGFYKKYSERNRDTASINIRGNTLPKDFFPDPGTIFTVITDDKKSLAHLYFRVVFSKINVKSMS